MKIFRCLATRNNAVYVPTKEDRNVKEYARMRDDHKLELKRTKQQIFEGVQTHKIGDGGDVTRGSR